MLQLILLTIMLILSTNFQPKVYLVALNFQPDLQLFQYMYKNIMTTLKNIVQLVSIALYIS